MWTRSDRFRGRRTDDAHLRRVEPRAIGERQGKHVLGHGELGTAPTVGNLASAQDAAVGSPHAGDELVFERQRIGARGEADRWHRGKEPNTRTKTCAALQEFAAGNPLR